MDYDLIISLVHSSNKEQQKPNDATLKNYVNIFLYFFSIYFINN